MRNSKILNIFSVIASVLLNIILICLTVFTPFYFSVTVFTKAETIVKIVQNINYETVIQENETLGSTLEGFGISSEKINQAMKSEEAAKLIEVYADNTIEILMETPTNKIFDVPTVQNLIVENIDGFLDAAEKTYDKPFPKEEIKKQVISVVKGDGKVVESVIPVIEPIRIVIETVKASELLRNTLKPSFAIILFVFAVILIAAIIFLQPKLKSGTLWLGASFTISAAILLAVIIYSKSAFLKLIAEKVSYFEAEILTSTINLSRERLNLGFFVAAIIAIICFGFYIGWSIYKKKKLQINKKE